jgi:uncharacterized protein YdeI (YjbR/CyaY-like superfamily)
VGVQDDAERVEPTTLAQWAEWLARHHDRGHGVWVVAPRRAADRPYAYEDAVVEALRWGWVDSTVRPVDERRTMMWFSPRRRGSLWTGPNRERVARLEAAGRMEPPGRAAVAEARASGVWAMMEAVDRLEVPDDLAAALDARDGAREHWESFPPTVRKATLVWILTAKRTTTRAVRVEETADRAARGERVGG